jgi:hypothetical protein
MLSVIMKNVIMLGSWHQARGLTQQMIVSAKKAAPEASVMFMVTVNYAECHK